MTLRINADTQPLNKWPANINNFDTIEIGGGDHTQRGQLSVVRQGVTIVGCPDSLIHSFRLTESDLASVYGVNWLVESWVSKSNGVQIVGCSTTEGRLRLIGNASNCVVDGCRFSRAIPVGDMPAITISGHWRLRYSDNAAWVVAGRPEDDWHRQDCHNNVIRNCVIENYPDGIGVMVPRDYPYTEAVQGLCIENNRFEVTTSAVDDNNEWSGENIFVDIKSGGSASNPVVIRGNQIIGQRKSDSESISFAGGFHIAATNIVVERNTFADCDSALFTTVLEIGAVDPNYQIRNNIFTRIRKTSADSDAGYMSNAGRVFSGSNTLHCEGNLFIDCEYLAREYGRYFPSTFTNNRSVGGMNFNPYQGRPYSLEQWVRDGNINSK